MSKLNAIMEKEIDDALVIGEITLRYPSCKALARRTGLTEETIQEYSRTHDCMARRKQAIRKMGELLMRDLEGKLEGWLASRNLRLPSEPNQPSAKS